MYSTTTPKDDRMKEAEKSIKSKLADIRGVEANRLVQRKEEKLNLNETKFCCWVLCPHLYAK